MTRKPSGRMPEMSDLEKWAMERRVKRARRKMVSNEILRRFLSIYAVGFMLLALISALIKAITQ